MDIEETKERDCKSLSLMKQLIRSDAAKLLSQLVGSEYAEDILNNKTGADERSWPARKQRLLIWQTA